MADFVKLLAFEDDGRVDVTYFAQGEPGRKGADQGDAERCEDK